MYIRIGGRDVLNKKKKSVIKTEKYNLSASVT